MQDIEQFKSPAAGCSTTSCSTTSLDAGVECLLLGPMRCCSTVTRSRGLAALLQAMAVFCRRLQRAVVTRDRPSGAFRCEILPMATAELSMNSRVGRENQRYGTAGERLVAGIVPLSADKYYVLLIQSTRRGGWVLPKGGWENDETVEAAARREAWEEAGIICTITYDLGLVPERRRPEELTTEAPKASYHFFEATVDKQEAQWPEMHKRARQWFTYTQARQALATRPELVDALDRCTMKRS